MSGKNTSSEIWIAGAFAAFTVDLLVYPLDTLKTRIQSPDYKRLFTNASTQAVNNRALFRGLYQGVGSVIIATLPSSGAFFSTYEGTKAILSNHNPTWSGHPLLPQAIIHSAASSVGELVSCAILTPAEVIKQNAQMVMKGGDKSSQPYGNATLQTLKRFRSNPLALWRGYTALAGRNLPFTALQFPMFERLRQKIHQYRDERKLTRGTIVESGLITAFSAGSAGSVAAVVTTPIDVVKTRIMLAAAEDGAKAAQQPASAPSSGTAKAGKNGGLVDAVGNTVKSGADGVVGAVKEVALGHKQRQSSLAIAREIMADQGVKGLFRGGALRAVWTMLGSGLYLGVYDSGRIWLASRRGENLNPEELF